MPGTSLFQKYALIQIQISELEQEKKQINQEIFSQLKKDEVDKAVVDKVGTFSIVRRTTYIYPEGIDLKLKEIDTQIKLAVDPLEQQKEAIKLDAIENKLCTEDVSETLRFTPKNDQEKPVKKD